MTPYPVYYREHGSRTATHFESPRIFTLDRFVLPKNTCYHYTNESGVGIGPKDGDTLFKPIKQKIPLFNLVKMDSPIGQYTHVNHDVMGELRQHVRNNRKFRLLWYLDSLNFNPLIPLVVNYSLAGAKLLYRGNQLREHYYHAFNLVQTIRKAIKDVLLTSGSFYQHYLTINVPDTLVPVSEMKRAVSKMAPVHYSMFGDLSMYMIFELWKWCGLNRGSSIFSLFDESEVQQINIVFQHNNHFFLVNLGVLDKFRRSDSNPKGNFAPRDASKKFLKSLLKLIKSTDADVNLEDEQIIEEEDLTKEEENLLLRAASIDAPAFKPKKEKPGYVEKDEDSDDDIITIPPEETVEDETYLSVLDEEDELPVVDKVYGPKSEEEKQREQETEDLQYADILDVHDDEIITVDHFIRKTPEEKGLNAVTDFLSRKNVTSTQRDGLIKAAQHYKEIKVNTDKGVKDVEALVTFAPGETDIKPEDTKGISTLTVFDKKYIDDIMEKDITSMITNLQAHGVLIRDIQREVVGDVLGEEVLYSIKVKPIEGEPSTIRFRLPRVKEDGSFTINGVDYIYRKQRVDLPIRKVNENTVSLTSYYGKTFVRRNETTVSNYSKWLTTQIRKIAFDKMDNRISETRTSNVFDYTLDTPSIYSLLAKEFRSIKTPKYHVYLDYHKSRERFGDEAVNLVERKGYTFVGESGNNHYLGVDKNNVFYSVDKLGVSSPLGNIEDIFGIPVTNKTPVEFLSIDIMGEKVPLCVPLLMRYGLKGLLKLLNPTVYKTVPVNQRYQPTKDEWIVKFNDFYLVLSRKDVETSLILAGLRRFSLSDLSILDLNHKEIWFDLLASIGINGRLTIEIDLMRNLFVDPITERILEELNLPVTFDGLLFHATKLLVNYQHPSEIDMAQQRIRGFERFSGEVYNQMVRAVRRHGTHGIKSKYPVEMNPEAVWVAISTDTNKITSESLNPLQDLKQQEITSFTGNGGRSKQSMVKRTRAHHKNAIGVISEGSVDSGDTGVTSYLSSNPKFTSLYGLTENATEDRMMNDLKPDNIISTTGLMYPCNDMDDMKRQNFTQVQQSHTIPSPDYRVLPVRTGYDDVVAKRASDRYLVTAKQDGKVIDVDELSLTVEYKDGTQKMFELGKWFGVSGNFHLPHDTVTRLKAGDTFKAGDTLAYHKDFFTPDDYLGAGKMALKLGRLARVVLMEDPLSYEDSTAVSKHFAETTNVSVSYIKDVVVKFNQNIHKVAIPGKPIDVDEPLCYIEEDLGDEMAMDDNTVDLLKVITSNAPKSPTTGIVDKVEVFYYGEKEEMSTTLLRLATQSDKVRSRISKAKGAKGYSGQVDDRMRVDGNPMEYKTALIRFTITTTNGLSGGDKMVYCNQLKCTIAEVYQEPPRTVSEDMDLGQPLDAVFSTSSVYNRIVNSPFLVGFTNVILTEVSRQLGEEYFKD